jgi:hypothetical protein
VSSGDKRCANVEFSVNPPDGDCLQLHYLHTAINVDHIQRHKPFSRELPACILAERQRVPATEHTSVFCYQDQDKWQQKTRLYAGFLDFIGLCWMMTWWR